MQVVAIDLDLDQDVNEGEKREHQLGASAHCSYEDRGQSQRLIEDPAEGRDEQRDEKKQAAVFEPVPLTTARPKIDESPDGTENGGHEGEPLGVGIDGIAQEISEAGGELARGVGSAHV